MAVNAEAVAAALIQLSPVPAASLSRPISPLPASPARLADDASLLKRSDSTSSARHRRFSDSLQHSPIASPNATLSRPSVYNQQVSSRSEMVPVLMQQPSFYDNDGAPRPVFVPVQSSTPGSPALSAPPPLPHPQAQQYYYGQPPLPPQGYMMTPPITPDRFNPNPNYPIGVLQPRPPMNAAYPFQNLPPGAILVPVQQNFTPQGSPVPTMMRLPSAPTGTQAGPPGFQYYARPMPPVIVPLHSGSISQQQMTHIAYQQSLAQASVSRPPAVSLPQQHSPTSSSPTSPAPWPPTTNPNQQQAPERSTGTLAAARASSPVSTPTVPESRFSVRIPRKRGSKASIASTRSVSSNAGEGRDSPGEDSLKTGARKRRGSERPGIFGIFGALWGKGRERSASLQRDSLGTGSGVTEGTTSSETIVGVVTPEEVVSDGALTPEEMSNESPATPPDVTRVQSVGLPTPPTPPKRTASRRSSEDGSEVSEFGTYISFAADAVKLVEREISNEAGANNLEILGMSNAPARVESMFVGSTSPKLSVAIAPASNAEMLSTGSVPGRVDSAFSGSVSSSNDSFDIPTVVVEQVTMDRKEKDTEAVTPSSAASGVSGGGWDTVLRKDNNDERGRTTLSPVSEDDSGASTVPPNATRERAGSSSSTVGMIPIVAPSVRLESSPASTRPWRSSTLNPQSQSIPPHERVPPHRRPPPRGDLHGGRARESLVPSVMFDSHMIAKLSNMIPGNRSSMASFMTVDENDSDIFVDDNAPPLPTTGGSGTVRKLGHTRTSSSSRSNVGSSDDVMSEIANGVKSGSAQRTIVDLSAMSLPDRMEYAKNRLKSRSGADTDEIVEAATFLLDHVQHAPKHLQKTFSEASIKSLKRLSDREGLPEAQYYLARLYLRGIPGFEKGHKPDFAKAFSFLLSAAKKEHAEGTFLLALMFEMGVGSPASTPRALQHYRKAAVSNHPGAMYRLGMALLRGEMGMGRNTRDGVKWIKLSAKYADERYPHGLYELAMLHDKGVHNYVWTDHTYLVKCLTEAATLGHLGSQLKLGEAYEYGHFGVRVDPARSVYFYALAAGKSSAEAIFEIGGWYLTGADDATSGFHLERSHLEAFRWAKRAADLGLARAMHAVGYFYETGVGVPSAEVDEESKKMSGEWYRRAAERGDARAAKKVGKGGKGKEGKGKESGGWLKGNNHKDLGSSAVNALWVSVIGKVPASVGEEGGDKQRRGSDAGNANGGGVVGAVDVGVNDLNTEDLISLAAEAIARLYEQTSVAMHSAKSGNGNVYPSPLGRNNHSDGNLPRSLSETGTMVHELQKRESMMSLATMSESGSVNVKRASMLSMASGVSEAGSGGLTPILRNATPNSDGGNSPHLGAGGDSGTEVFGTLQSTNSIGTVMNEEGGGGGVVVDEEKANTVVYLDEATWAVVMRAAASGEGLPADLQATVEAAAAAASAAGSGGAGGRAMAHVGVVPRTN
ncbi:hypothetical protein BJ742DRAFT_888194 [Cladochytrium replicatum]|nr:hypothetical protein BJ742DRAFT_888194 [Cladochytrium replicatum]